MDISSSPPPPPTPWIGKTAASDSTSATEQAWANKIDPNALFAIRFPSDYSGGQRLAYHYCYSAAIILCWILLAGGILLGTNSLGIIIYFVAVVGKHPITADIFQRAFRDIGRAEVDYLLHFLPCLLIFPALYLLSVGLYKIFPTLYGNKRSGLSQWQFGCLGGAYRTQLSDALPRSLQYFTTFRWKDIQQIRYQDGDMHFISRNILIRYFFFVPRESFVDAEAATRFYDAVTTLWKTQGDPTALPETAFTEFAPRRSVS